MIFAKLESAKDYLGISPNLDKALGLLTPEFLRSLGDETVHVDAEKLFVSRGCYETKAPEDTFYESHIRYLDIHAVIRGEELIEVADAGTLTADEAASDPGPGDAWIYREKSAKHLPVVLRPGTFLVVFPADAHRCKCRVSGPCEVEKAVFKILIE